MSVKKIKKIPLLVWPGKLKTWWLFLLILLTFGANKATSGDFCYSWGLPRTPVRSLTSLATLPPSLISQPVQFSDFDEFWELLLFQVFSVGDRAWRKRGGGWRPGAREMGPGEGL